MIRSLGRLLLLVVFCCSSVGAWAQIGSVKAGVEAYERGEFELAYEVLVPHARNGDAQSQYLVGRLYQDGQGVEASEDLGLMWLRRAADRGFPAALELVGQIESPLPRARDPILSIARMEDGEIPPDSSEAMSDDGRSDAMDGDSMEAMPGSQKSMSPIRSTPGGRYWVQVGAYLSESKANEEWRLRQTRHADIVEGLDDRVQMAQVSDYVDPIYRLQLGPVSGLDTANELCTFLIASEVVTECFSVDP